MSADGPEDREFERCEAHDAACLDVEMHELLADEGRSFTLLDIASEVRKAMADARSTVGRLMNENEALHRENVALRRALAKVTP